MDREAAPHRRGRALRARALAKNGRISSTLPRGPIVELGPGTGPVTKALLERGVAPERLVLVEYESNSAICWPNAIRA